MAHNRSPKKKGLASTVTLLGFLLIVGLAVAALYSSTEELKAKEQTYIEREETLNKEIAEQETLKLSLEERKKYVTTDQYIEEIAREKLGLLGEDEVLLREYEN